MFCANKINERLTRNKLTSSVPNDIQNFIQNNLFYESVFHMSATMRWQSLFLMTHETMQKYNNFTISKSSIENCGINYKPIKGPHRNVLPSLFWPFATNVWWAAVARFKLSFDLPNGNLFNGLWNVERMWHCDGFQIK